MSDDDPLLQRLRGEIWADPDADAPREVLADYLIERGDPLGELIAIQLERARTHERPTDHEHELIRVHGRRLSAPITDWLQISVIERGALAKAVPQVDMPVEATRHPVWSTVEQLSVRHPGHPIFDSPHLRARYLHVNEAVCHALARRTTPLPVRVLAGLGDHGLGFDKDQLDVFDHGGVFDNVRVLELGAWHLDEVLAVRSVLASRLIQPLEHLALTFGDVELDRIRRWRQWAETANLARFSVYLPLDQNDPPPMDESVWHGDPSNHTYFELDGDRVIVQLDEPTYDDHVEPAVAVVAELGRTRVIVEDVADAHRIEQRHAALLAGLRARFEVEVTARPVRSRQP